MYITYTFPGEYAASGGNPDPKQEDKYYFALMSWESGACKIVREIHDLTQMGMLIYMASMTQYDRDTEHSMSKALAVAADRIKHLEEFEGMFMYRGVSFDLRNDKSDGLWHLSFDLPDKMITRKTFNLTDDAFQTLAGMLDLLDAIAR